jgi:phenylpropionate dioxygenase-like ring-hydroxylating dioxygenase large terminal subunit
MTITIRFETGRERGTQRRPPPRPSLIPSRTTHTHSHNNNNNTKRGKELTDKAGYLGNMWYAVALTENVMLGKPLKVELCGKEMVLYRNMDGSAIHCIDNICPHRGAPLSKGWIETHAGQTCITCPYHGWALSGQGEIMNVPAVEKKGEWPKRNVSRVYNVEEKGGFVWLLYDTDKRSANENKCSPPPIPYVPELDDPSWKATYQEIEFQGPHFTVMENGIDFAHIFFLHDFGNVDKPEIKNLSVIRNHDDAASTSVSATFDIHNSPVNLFWALFQIPIVHVWAKAFLPSSSVVTFTLGAGVSFTTFVSTTPVSRNKTVNRFALVRTCSWDKTGIFINGVWDIIAKRAMLKIQNEDKIMIEQLKHDQVPVEYNVGIDAFQVAFRVLRQRYIDSGFLVPPDSTE